MFHVVEDPSSFSNAIKMECSGKYKNIRIITPFRHMEEESLNCLTITSITSFFGITRSISKQLLGLYLLL